MSPSRTTRRTLVGGLLASPLLGSASLAKAPTALAGVDLKPYRTPYKLNRLVLAKSGVEGSFDSKFVDCPFVFSANGKFGMTYIGFDGSGYQTGLAESDDLVNWRRVALILKRDPANPVFRYNFAMMCILRENELTSEARLTKVNGRYLGAWHAYPNEGMEEGAAVIGLCWSDDLLHWELEPPCLFPQHGAEWERGGLYKPYLIKEGDTYYLFYNAKTAEKSWREQTGLATSKDLKTWTRFAGNPLIHNGAKGPSWDDRFASDPCVVRHQGMWAMYYYGLASDGKARELLALGRDPFHFTKTDEILIDVGPKGSVDDDYAHKPSVISHKGDLYHFYTAVSGPWPNDVRGISVARSRPWAAKS
jgi:predicted GH43/DUF377 family glycosyl hydrolase